MPDPSFPENPQLVAEDVPGDNSAPLSVGELASKLKRFVESEFGHVRIRGEISGYKRVASGHARGWQIVLQRQGQVIRAYIDG